MTNQLTDCWDRSTCNCSECHPSLINQAADKRSYTDIWLSALGALVLTTLLSVMGW